MITSRANAKIKWVRSLQAKRADREAAGVFVVEGSRLLEEAAHSATPAQLVLHTEELDARGQAAVAALRQQGTSVEAVTPEVMAAASEAQSPPGLLPVVPMPHLPVPSPLTFALVLDRLGDPGNLGTILRTAAAAGVQAAYLAPGTVDPYNPKVVRAAMGAHFHLPLVAAEWEALPGLARQPDDIALLQHSSGTTGLQKGVALSHRAVLRQRSSPPSPGASPPSG